MGLYLKTREKKRCVSVSLTKYYYYCNKNGILEIGWNFDFSLPRTNPNLQFYPLQIVCASANIAKIKVSKEYTSKYGNDCDSSLKRLQWLIYIWIEFKCNN